MFMKKQISSFFSAAFRKTMFFFGFAGLTTLNLIPVAAQAQEKVRTVPPAVSISYVGTVNEQPVFQIEFENRNDEVLNLSIRDEQGTILFSEKFRDKKFSKKFQFEKTGIDNMRLTFTLAGEKEKQSQSFEINTNVRVIQDVVVTRL